MLSKRLWVSHVESSHRRDAGKQVEAASRPGAYNAFFSILFKLLNLLLLRAEVLGGVDHVGQSLLSLGPSTGLQTAVWVDPELVWLEVLQHLGDTVLDLLLAWDTWAVDVVDTRADVSWVGLVDEDLEKLGVRLAVLDGQNVSIESGDGVEEVLEFGVAEVRVDLGAIHHTSSGQLEAVNSPAEVLLTLGAGTEWKTLT